MVKPGSFTYQAVSGFFEFTEAPVGPSYRAITTPGLGLISRTYATDADFDPTGEKTQWERFAYFLEQQNQKGNGNVQYKLIFYIRHGEGFHNVKEAQVGRDEWDNKWSHLDGDGTVSWFDAFLTEQGKHQAQALNDFWQKSTRDLKMPFPQMHYTSPHARCLETTKIAYSGIHLPEEQLFKPMVKERLRERSGVHTCDQRRTKSWIASHYPEYEIEPGFPQADELWNADVRETESDVESRVKMLLDDVFEGSNATLLSFTAHSGLVHGLHAITKHRDVWVAPGAIVPFLIKATR
ncbi:phosphoglycerate mutase-like protein [Xylariaceae sp. AK1471]|nr:phosphoglycerate mutase-like protein [Xylariaceae sp. AK1471]